MTKARTHSRNAFPSPSNWKYVASLRKSTVIVRFSRVGLAAVPMCYPQVIRCRELMRHHEGNVSPSQANREGLRALPRNAMECGLFLYSGSVAGRAGSCRRPKDRHCGSDTEDIGGADLSSATYGCKIDTFRG